VDGDIAAPRLLIQEGAVVNGSIQMGTAAKSTQTAQTAEAPAQASHEIARKTG
jgi:cytoskeletal protein CcmA (bactofilin family)